MIRLGITGTDTGIGKTSVAVALLRRLRQRGLHVAGMKPIETGVAPGDPASDAARLRAAAGGSDAFDDVCPLVLPEPLAPWIAAERAGIRIDQERLDTAFERLRAGCDAVLVEGAGGIRVPLTRDTSFLDLFRRWELDVVVVAGNRLGVLNHALLTVHAARDAGLRVRGVVLNELAAQTTGLAEPLNRDALAALLPGTPVIAFPWLAGGAADAATAAMRELDALVPEIPNLLETR